MAHRPAAEIDFAVRTERRARSLRPDTPAACAPGHPVQRPHGRYARPSDAAFPPRMRAGSGTAHRRRARATAGRARRPRPDPRRRRGRSAVRRSGAGARHGAAVPATLRRGRVHRTLGAPGVQRRRLGGALPRGRRPPRQRATGHARAGRRPQLPPDDNPFERCNRWLLDTALACGGEHVWLLCLWDGQGGDGAGGTAHMVGEVQRHHGHIIHIDCRQLWQRTGP